MNILEDRVPNLKRARNKVGRGDKRCISGAERTLPRNEVCDSYRTRGVHGPSINRNCVNLNAPPLSEVGANSILSKESMLCIVKVDHGGD